MNVKKFSDAMDELDSKYLDEALHFQKRDRKSRWLPWGAMAACLCILLASVFAWLPGARFWEDEHALTSGCTLPGASEIYPTVMVEDQLYEWRRGMAIARGLPDDSVLYGAITHVEESTPQHNCEFAATFNVTGEIYLVESTSNSVYLVMTTDWLQDAVVIFDLVE